jgi:hypothetical protein
MDVSAMPEPRARVRGIKIFAAIRGTADMEGVAELRISLKVELKVGPNWAEMSGAA